MTLGSSNSIGTDSRKANLAGGKMSDPVSLPLVSSLDEAVGLLNGLSYVSKDFSITNANANSPLPEIDANQPLVGVATRGNTNDVHIHVRGFNSEGRTLNAYRIKYATEWYQWSRPKGWIKIWDNGGAGAVDNTYVKIGFANGDHIRITAIADACVATGEGLVDYRYQDSFNRCFIGVPFYHYTGTNSDYVQYACYYGVMCHTDPQYSFINIRRQTTSNMAAGLLPTNSAHHRVLKIEKEVYI